jgi:hypothetical protein
LAALACLAYLASEVYVFYPRLGLPLDDSWIHLRFAGQLAAGEGLAYDSGRWVAGSTAPLWTALLALVSASPLPPVLGAKLLGVFFFLASVDATSRLAAELSLSRGLGRLAASATAATHWLVWSALSGMEVALFCWLSLWGMVLHLRERRSPPAVAPLGGPGGGTTVEISLPVLALACLARPEGGLLFAAALVDRLLPARTAAAGLAALRRLSAPLAAAALVVVPTFVFYRTIGDSFLPTTFAVKSSPDPDFLPDGRYLRTVMDVFLRSQPVLTLFAGAGVVGLVSRLATARQRGLLPVFWVLGLPLAYSLLAAEGGPVIVGNFGRYYFPLLPVVALLGVLGWEGAARRLGRVPRVLLVAVLLPQAWGLATGPPRYVRTIANVESSDVAAALWLAERLPPEAILAVQDVGALKYHLDNPVIDLTGIVNPEILPHLRGRDGQERLLAFLAERRPDYLVVFPEYYPRIVGAPGMTPIRSFPVADNVTMAGDELVVFGTPWNDQPLAEGAGR